MRICGLKNDHDSTVARLEQIEKLLDDSAGQANANRNTPGRWHEIEALLAVPFLEPGLRRDLVKASRDISLELKDVKPYTG